MENHPTNPDARALEDAFFARKDAKLLEALRQRARQVERRASLREAVPNADDALLDRLLELGMGPETVLAVVLVPLAAVAWADGAVDDRERAALLRAAAERGVAPGSPGMTLLEGWLERPPGKELLKVWKTYVSALWGSLSDVERRAMHDRMIGMARGVAEAAGGFLGLGQKISAAERAALEELEQALR
jgi:hypothetical protein